ncbi:MAG: cysteine--tRNA ligase [Candidatus Omnitrophica bacterium]|nr:cysteine--tRNA ligase [Candidatus Omnitrophota bacterium]
MKIYNSLTREKEEFVPINGNKVNMYSCGVTVYDKCHIGHARSLYIFDVIRRHLKNSGFDVTFVRNITDVDDKIIAKANQLGKKFEDVVEENISLYENDLEMLKVDKADIEPRATHNIDGMKTHIQTLIDKGFAYESDGDVYFKVRKFENYGKLSGQSIEKMLEGVRIEADSKKKDPLDFVLWKRSKEGEPSWPSPWGEGRPGWHIECSVMSMKELGCDTLDIHAGGRDLVFPHHENEIAQSEALTGKPFAKYWIHHGLLKIDGQKMAKSLGNFITVEEALEKYGVDDIKMFFLSSHYSSEIDFSDKNIEESHKKIQKIKIFLSEASAKTDHVTVSSIDAVIEDYRNRFIGTMDDDFNTPKALGVIFEMITEVNKSSYEQMYVDAAKVIVELCQNTFGLSLNDDQAQGLTDAEQMLIDERINARAQKDYKRSDDIRDKLKDIGIIVEDGKDGHTWRRA